MPIILVGLNHRTAPVALREQLSLNDCSLQMALEDLRLVHNMPVNQNGQSLPGARITQGVILSTCNRLEVYAVTPGEPREGWQIIEDFLCALQGISPEKLRPHLYFMSGFDAINHIMRVAAGLDSMILGESQILGQVSQALLEAQAAGTTGAVLSQLFERAAHSGKRARTETAISRHSTSTSHAASRLIGEMTGGLNDAHVLIVGAGEMAEVAARALSDRGVGKLSFINRTYSRAESVARKVPGQALNWSELHAILVSVNAVLTATGAPHVVIHKSDVQQALEERAGKPLIVVDIAVPRDVEMGVGELTGVRLFDIDDLKSVVDDNIASRQAAIPQVEAIVQEEADRFQEWLRERGVVPVLVALRQKAKGIAQEEMKRNSEEFERLDPEGQERISRMVNRIVNKLLHEPTVRLKAAAANGNGVEYADALRDLFALETSGVSESKTPGPEHPDGDLTGRDQKYAVIEGTLTKEGQS